MGFWRLVGTLALGLLFLAALPWSLIVLLLALILGGVWRQPPAAP